MISIYSADDARVRAYTLMTNARELYERERVVVAEGATTVRRLLQSSLPVLSFFATPRYYAAFANELQHKQQRGDLSKEHCFIADASVMNAIVGFALHEGVMALAKEPACGALYDHARTIALPAVCLLGVVNSENVGAIVRNCVAFGVPSLIIDNATSSPYLRRAVRVSLGGILGMNVYHTRNFADDMQELKETRGVPIIAAEITPRAHILPDLAFPEEFVLCFGGEGKGLQSQALSSVDAVVRIPLIPLEESAFAVNSLNVAASSAIVLYHARVLATGLPRYEFNTK